MACAAGCGWIVGVSDDPVVVDGPREDEGGPAEAGSDDKTPVDGLTGRDAAED